MWENADKNIVNAVHKSLKLLWGFAVERGLTSTIYLADLATLMYSSIIYNYF